MEARYFVNVRWFKAAVSISNAGNAAASPSAGNTWGEWTSTECDKI